MRYDYVVFRHFRGCRRASVSETNANNYGPDGDKCVTSRFEETLSLGLNHHVVRLEPPRPLGLTTLESLQRYASHQTELIESPPLLKSRFRDLDDYDDWLQLHESTWAKNLDSFDGTEKVTRGPDAIDDSLTLLDVVPPDYDTMLKSEVTKDCRSFERECEKIPIRSEYKEAEEFALCGAKLRALVVIGQPGIGSSPFCSVITRS